MIQRLYSLKNSMGIQILPMISETLAGNFDKLAQKVYIYC
jgi:hypothetical protein